MGKAGGILADVLETSPEEHADACFALLAAAGSQDALEKTSERGMPCLSVAAARGFVATTRLLVEKRADLDMRSHRDNLTALDSAINSGSVKTAHVLLDSGGRSSQPQDALLVAAGQASDSVAQRLVTECNADVDGTIAC